MTLSPQKAARKKSAESKRGRTVRAGSGSGEIRLPPNPFPRRGSAASYKPVFGSFRPNGTAGGPGSEAGDYAQEDRHHIPGAASSVSGGISQKGGSSEPMSRQASTSAATSPQRSRTQASSPVKARDMSLPLPGSVPGSIMSELSGLRIGAGPYIPSASVMMQGSSTAPLPQGGFPSMPNGLPVGGGMRGARGGRQSFSGRGGGRGAYRGGFKGSPSGAGMGMSMLDQGMPGMGYIPNGYGSSAVNANTGPGGRAGGPEAGGGRAGVTPNGISGYEGSGTGAGGARGGMYPAWDPMQGYGMPVYGTPGGSGPGRSGQIQGLPMPPPPMPATQAVGLDPLRFYVLGQVSIRSGTLISWREIGF